MDDPGTLEGEGAATGGRQKRGAPRCEIDAWGALFRFTQPQPGMVVPPLGFGVVV